jgi:hypothetical protein
MRRFTTNCVSQNLPCVGSAWAGPVLGSICGGPKQMLKSQAAPECRAMAEATHRMNTDFLLTDLGNTKQISYTVYV